MIFSFSSKCYRVAIRRPHISIRQSRRIATKSKVQSAEANAETEFFFNKRAHRVKNPILFPWRHAEEPLPRLIPETDEFMLHGGYVGPNMPALPQTGRASMLLASAISLEIPWWKIITRSWEQDLANQMAWAFSQSVAGILSNTYRVPFDNITSSHSEEDEDGFEIDFNDNLIADSEADEDFTSPSIQDMMQENLSGIYEHARLSDELEVTLRMSPVSAELQSMLIIPALTRSIVKETPRLKHAFLRDLLAKIEHQPSGWEAFRIGQRHFYELDDQTRDPITNTSSISLIAQTQVFCREAFSVRDRKTGELLQGDGAIRIVPHLVRFEMVVRVGGSEPGLGSWIITDWDDLLEGNVWYT